jgi:hypothetical protein
MVRSMVTISCEGMSKRMLRIKNGRLCCSVGDQHMRPYLDRSFKLIATYPRNGYRRYQIIEAGFFATSPAKTMTAVPTVRTLRSQ